MSLAKSLRSMLQNLDSPIVQVAQQHIPKQYRADDGFIWFSRRATQAVRTMEQATAGPDQQYFDVEIYHPSIDVVEATADALHLMDRYQGPMGNGRVQAMFVENQSDDYVPRVDMTDTENLSSAFLSLEIRSYKESS